MTTYNFGSVYGLLIQHSLNKVEACIDVPRPLSNDLWVFLREKLDAVRLERASRAGTSVFVKYFKVNIMPETYF